MTARRGAFAIVACVVFAYATPAGAMQQGIVGYSGKHGPTCNDDCHINGTAPQVRFEGPRHVVADAIATFRFVVTSPVSRQKVAGFNVAASDGTLGIVAGQAEHVEFEELTHDAPKPNVNNVASWIFTWQVPGQVGVYTLFGAGLSANGNGTDGGDSSDLTTFNVTVVPESFGDGTCDARVSAPDVTAVVQRLPSGVPGACSGADVDGDGTVNAGDVPVVIAALFGE